MIVRRRRRMPFTNCLAKWQMDCSSKEVEWIQLLIRFYWCNIHKKMAKTLFQCIGTFNSNLYNSNVWVRGIINFHYYVRLIVLSWYCRRNITITKLLLPLFLVFSWGLLSLSLCRFPLLLLYHFHHVSPHSPPMKYKEFVIINVFTNNCFLRLSLHYKFIISIYSFG